jgi:hypothetical protein
MRRTLVMDGTRSTLHGIVKRLYLVRTIYLCFWHNLLILS